MNCKACSTKIPPDKKACPACGRTMVTNGPSQNASSSSENHPPLSSNSALEPSPATKPRSTPKGARPKQSKGKGASSDRGKSVAKPPLAPKAKAQSKSVAAKAKLQSKPVKAKLPSKSVKAKLPSKPAKSIGASLFSLDPAQLRTLLGEMPDLLEAGLMVMCGDAGQPKGHRYETDVGEIDLLARDEAGAFVVVTVADYDSTPSLIGDILKRVGWVRTHLAKDGTEVRAIVLTEPLSEEMRYAAAAVSETVDFKTYRVSLSFEDLDLS